MHGIEYNAEETQTINKKYEIKNVSFGLEERPRTNFILTTQIENVVLTLNNGIVLLDVKNDIKAGLKIMPNTYEFGEKQKVVKRNSWALEIDEELLHGSELKIYYKLKVENSGEVDTVGESYDLNKINNISLGEAENMLGNAYYYGNTKDTQIVTTSIDKIIEYVDKSIAFNKDAEINPANKWNEAKILDLQNKGILSKEIRITTNTSNNNPIMTEALKDNKLNPKSYINAQNTIDKNEETLELLLSKVLGRNSKNNDYTYACIAEIIEFSNTVGRRAPDQIVGDVKPQVINKVNEESPDKDNDIPDEIPLENGEDASEKFIITSPTGGNAYTIYYITAIIAGTVFIAGIILIKKLFKNVS